MRRVCIVSSLAAGWLALIGGCSSDSDSKSKASAGNGGAAGAVASGGTSAGKGGSSSGGATGGDAGSPGGEAGNSSGGSDAGSSGAGGQAGGDGDGGQAGGDAGSSGAGGEGGSPECSPAADDCPSGSYCTEQNVCAPGCKDGSSCASGVCGADHDCEPCLADGECAEGRVCGTGTCSAACSEDVAGSCGDGFSCCETRCVDTARDVDNCGGCGVACDATQFCGTSGCVSAVASNVCLLARATAVLDDLPADDQVAQDILAALAAQCSPPPVTQSISQAEASQINTSTGQVVTSGGELLVFAGGPAVQITMKFLEDQRATPVYYGGAFPQIAFYKRADDGLIVSRDFYASTASHDILVIQIGRELVTGTPALIAYGFDESGSGTRAAGWQFINGILPNLETVSEAYWVYEWTDADADLLPDADEFTLLDSG